MLSTSIVDQFAQALQQAHASRARALDWLVRDPQAALGPGGLAPDVVDELAHELVWQDAAGFSRLEHGSHQASASTSPFWRAACERSRD